MAHEINDDTDAGTKRELDMENGKPVAAHSDSDDEDSDDTADDTADDE
jgi:hypothetical protein